jgi:RNA polymerase sigma-70 factor, ECF subfamily
VAAEAVPLGSGASEVTLPRAQAEVSDFDALYARYFDFVWRNVRRLGVPDPEVDDAAQEVFLVVHRKLADYEPRASLKAWIFGIVARVASDHRRILLRKSTLMRSREAPVDPDKVASNALSGDEALEQCEAVELLHRLLDGLDDDKRAVFVLAELEQMSAPEIAEALGIKANTVYGRLRAARKEFDEGAARLRAQDAWRLR